VMSIAIIYREYLDLPLVSRSARNISMKIGRCILTEQSGNPGANRARGLRTRFESFLSAENMVVPSTYTTTLSALARRQSPGVYTRLIYPFVALALAAERPGGSKLGTAIACSRSATVETARWTAIDRSLFPRRRLILGSARMVPP